MRARAHRLANLTGSDDLEALLALVKDNELRYEYLDQDASIRHALGIDEQDEYILVQFKACVKNHLTVSYLYKVNTVRQNRCLLTYAL